MNISNSIPADFGEILIEVARLILSCVFPSGKTTAPRRKCESSRSFLRRGEGERTSSIASSSAEVLVVSISGTERRKEAWNKGEKDRRVIVRNMREPFNPHFLPPRVSPLC